MLLVVREPDLHTPGQVGRQLYGERYLILTFSKFSVKSKQGETLVIEVPSLLGGSLLVGLRPQRDPPCDRRTALFLVRRVLLEIEVKILLRFIFFLPEGMAL